MSAHAGRWTLRRRLQDKHVGRIHAGKRARRDQPAGLQPTPYGGMEDSAAFAALAKAVTR